MTCSYSTSDFNGCVFTKISLILPRTDAVHDTCKAPRSPHCSIWEKQFSWIALANLQLYKWRQDVWKWKHSNTLTTSQSKRQGEGTASMPRHSLQFAAWLAKWRTCWVYQCITSLFKSIQMNSWRWLWRFGTRQSEPSTNIQLKVTFRVIFIMRRFIVSWVSLFPQNRWEYSAIFHASTCTLAKPVTVGFLQLSDFSRPSYA